MTDIHPSNAAFYWATFFFRSLKSLGVHHIIISPGSRSTPLTLAAAAHDHFQKHVILDERSAAFTALGIGKATGTPPVLICTSGTALANYYPAVIEARQSGVPLLLATADRPPHLRATGANQAIDQLKIFGDYPVFFHEVGEPRLDVQDLKRLQLLADQAVTAANEQRGPAHLNFPFRKPLEPHSGFLQKIRKENDQLSTTDPDEYQAFFTMPESIQEKISQSRRPLILIGPTAPGDALSSVSRLADAYSIPVLSESSIQTSCSVTGFSGFLRNRSYLSKLEPDLLLRFGFQPTTKAMEMALNHWEPDHHLHFAVTQDWHDATVSSAKRIPWMGQPIKFNNLSSSADPEWQTWWRKAEQAYQSFYQSQLSRVTRVTDGGVYHHLTPQLSENWFIAASNSFPARDIQLFGQQAPVLPKFLNRGVSGIDGISSTAIGLSVGLQKPGVLFTGDLAFLHDSNALLNQKLLSHPLVIVVINNSGGGIFRMLPIEKHDQYFNTYFETPQSVELEQLVTSHDIPFCRISDLHNLQDFNLPQWVEDHHGLSVIEVQTDSKASMNLRQQLWNF